MLATMIADVFAKGEIAEVAESIEEICSPSDNYGWSSAGIYAFWCPSTLKLLYVGLAKDLHARFCQHSGLTKCKPNGCKVKEIGEYFGNNDLLGFTVFVQSTLMQPSCANAPAYFAGNAQNHDINQEIRNAEGMLIELWKFLDDDLPQWNKIKGGTEGQALSEHLISGDALDEIIRLSSGVTVTATHFQERLLLGLAANDNELVARASIRELAADSWLEGHEELVLHAARMRAATQRIDLQESIGRLRATPDLNSRVDAIVRENYLERSLPF